MNKFKHFLAGITLFFLFPALVFADGVPLSQAREVARNAFYEKINHNKSVDYDEITFNSETPEMYNGNLVYYAFNRGNNEGYIVIAADDRVYPVLAYTFEGNYNPSIQSPAWIEWMETYKKQIHQVIVYNAPGTQEISDAWARYSAPIAKSSIDNSKDISPLVKTQWDQDCYYNTACPVAAGGPCNHVVTGCVATAMAQIIKYHAYPSQGKGQHSYQSNYGVLSVDFSKQTYNYSSMPNKLTAENAEVAKLMFHCGVSVDMNYGPGGSGASTSAAQNSFIQYFRYANVAKYLDKTSMSDIKWKVTINADLLMKRPIMYRGSGTGGHAFILDGSHYPDHYHFNFGWSGLGDGYYYLTSINPSGNNFTNQQGGIFDLYPPTNEYNGVNNLSLNDQLTLYPNPTHQTINLNFDNDINGQLSLNVIDITGRVILTETAQKNQTFFSTSLNIAQLPAGYYFLKLQCNEGTAVKSFIVEQ